MCENCFVFSVNQIILLLNQIWNLDLLEKKTPQTQSALIGDLFFIPFIALLRDSSALLIVPGLFSLQQPNKPNWTN